MKPRTTKQIVWAGMARVEGVGEVGGVGGAGWGLGLGIGAGSPGRFREV